MIKTIVFDLDNTLLEWKDEYIFALINVLKKLNLSYDNNKIKEIDRAINDYENHYVKCTKQNFLEFINNKCNIDLPNIFVDLLIKEQVKCFEKYSEDELNTIKYLSSKYDLICITNWFTYTQKKRLENAGIGKYFKMITGGEEHELKPSLNAFSIIKNPSECIMIGDSISKDILPAIKYGMQAILITKKNVKKDLRYKRISKIEDLKEML